MSNKRARTLKEANEELERLRGDNYNLNKMIQHLPTEPIISSDQSQQISDLQKKIQQLKHLRVDVRSRYQIDVAYPYNTITPLEIRSEFNLVHAHAARLGNMLMSSFGSDRAHWTRVISNAQRDGSASEMIKWINTVPEIARLSRYEDTESIIVEAIIMRWVCHEIFPKGLCQIVPQVEQVFADIESSMVKKHMSYNEIKRWQFYSYSGAIAHPEYAARREVREHELATELAKVFNFMSPPGINIVQALLEVIKSAIRLQEQLLIAQARINFEFPSTAPSVDSSRAQLASDMLDKRDRIICANIMANNREIKLNNHTREEIVANLDPLCSVTPVIIYDSITESTSLIALCEKARVYAAWGNETKKREFLRKETPSLFYDLLSIESLGGWQ
ncbi:hypothetical protein F4804DRAFT_348412 [Jackrogersella minutella]|nr:hypothetical protein F4804DRAFT_348412 [Jackrogersella minutella]